MAAQGRAPAACCCGVLRKEQVVKVSAIRASAGESGTKNKPGDEIELAGMAAGAEGRANEGPSCVRLKKVDPGAAAAAAYLLAT